MVFVANGRTNKELGTTFMKQRYVFGALVIVILAVVGWLSLESSSLEYTNVKRAQRLGSTVQIVGTWVKENGSEYIPSRNTFIFTLRDQDGQEIPVELEGSKPNNFEIAVSLVVKGRVENGVLKAQNVLTKCPSKYEGTPADA